MSSIKIESADDFVSERHVYEHRRAGLPPLGRYFRGIWHRREFVRELATSNLRASHFDTALGQLWLVINPLLLGVVYFVLVDIVAHRSYGAAYFAHLLGGLFLYYFVSNAISSGARSVVSGGKLILNSAFPRAVLPLASTVTAFMRFLPTMIIYFAAHLVAGLPFGLHLLWLLPILLSILLFAQGAAMLVAALQVYFRDTSSFLPYLLRIWLYLSPVLWFADQVPARLAPVVHLNPLYSILGNWSHVLIEGKQADLGMLLIGFLWAVGILVVGGLFFLSREREFAVRL